MTFPKTMRAIVATTSGGPDVLTLAEVPTPSPRPGEVVVRVMAAGINAPDLAQRRGDYPPPADASPLLGLEVSGEIVHAAGEWAVGDKIIALCNGGGYAEYVAVPAGQILPLPDTWSFIEGAALPETWFTVTQTLVMRAGLAPGMSVLITGAAGGVGAAAIQIAKLIGADPIAVVSSSDKADYALSLGARAIIRRDSEDIVVRTLALTDGKGADRILDMIGGAATRQHIEAAARFGHIVLVSTLGDRNADLPLNKIVGKQLTISGSTLRPQAPATKAAIATHIRAHFWPALPGLNRPRIRTFGLADAAEAHRAFERPDHFGKIVLTVAPDQSR